ncbi:hypothetical protein MTR67_042183, partial [Solanum verrucosum]
KTRTRTQIVPTFCVLLSHFSLTHTMQLLISPSLRHVTVLPAKGFKEFVKVKVGSRRISYLMVFYSLLLFTFLLRFVFMLTAEDTIDGERKCSTLGHGFELWNQPLMQSSGCLGRKIGPRILGTQLESTVPEVIYQVLEEPTDQIEIEEGPETPQSLEEFMEEMKDTRPDAETFAVKLKAMVLCTYHAFSIMYRDKVNLRRSLVQVVEM